MPNPKMIASFFLLALISSFLTYALLDHQLVDILPTVPAPTSDREAGRSLAYCLEGLREQLLKHHTNDGQLHLCLYDFATRETIAIQGNRGLYPASMIKTLVLLAALWEVERGGLRMGNRYVLSERDKYVHGTRVAGTGVLQFVPEGESYTIRELLSLMIKKSDNVATNILIDLIGYDRINRTAERIGLKDTRISRKMYEIESSAPPNTSTACELNQIMIAFQEERLISRELATMGLRMMLGSEKKDRIAYHLRDDFLVSNKSGTTTSVVGDKALIYFPDREPVALTLIIENYCRLDEAETRISRIAVTVIEHLTR